MVKTAREATGCVDGGGRAVDAGVASHDGLVADDFDGEVRGGAPRVGADEVP